MEDQKQGTNRELLDFVEQYAEEHHYAPSIREIAKAIGVSSTSTVYYRLRALQAKGLVDWDDGKMRTLRVTRGSRT